MESAGTGREEDILTDPMRTKGTAFTAEERREHGLLGLLPHTSTTLSEQVGRCWGEVHRQATDLQRYVYLRSLQDRNEHLFYSVLAADVPTALPLVYTPTVAEGCRRFSALWRRPRGLYLAWPDREHLHEMLRNRQHDEVDVIVVTDGQRILGIGDQGVGGMGIPVGKLSLYTLIGGIDPARTLPILLDVGTDNADLRADPRYVGWRHKRVGRRDYDAFVEEFVAAVEDELPDVLLQWEDFATTHARPILDRYRDRLLTFNDDIQGTAAVVLGALTTACRLSGSSLSAQQVVMVGAGSAAIGVLDMVRKAMVRGGLSDAEAAARIWVVDVDGLLTRDRRGLTKEQKRYARPAADVADWPVTGPAQLQDVVDRVGVTALIGLSTVSGLFTEKIVRALGEHTERPIVFPLSNPTSHSEADPADLMRWTDGRALVATGSPYPPVEVAGKQTAVAQSNNVYIFPAMGLAVTAARATRVTDAMLIAAAEALGEAAAADASGTLAPLLPPVDELPATARRIALAAALAAVEDGVAPTASEPQLRAAIWETAWTPEYR